MSGKLQKNDAFYSFVEQAKIFESQPLCEDWLLQIWTGADGNPERAINHLLDTPDNKKVYATAKSTSAPVPAPKLQRRATPPALNDFLNPSTAFQPPTAPAGMMAYTPPPPPPVLQQAPPPPPMMQQPLPPAPMMQQPLPPPPTLQQALPPAPMMQQPLPQPPMMQQSLSPSPMMQQPFSQSPMTTSPQNTMAMGGNMMGMPNTMGQNMSPPMGVNNMGMMGGPPQSMGMMGGPPQSNGMMGGPPQSNGMMGGPPQGMGMMGGPPQSNGMMGGPPQSMGMMSCPPSSMGPGNMGVMDPMMNANAMSTSRPSSPNMGFRPSMEPPSVQTHRDHNMAMMNTRNNQLVPMATAPNMNMHCAVQDNRMEPYMDYSHGTPRGNFPQSQPCIQRARFHDDGYPRSSSRRRSRRHHDGPTRPGSAPDMYRMENVGSHVFDSWIDPLDNDSDSEEDWWITPMRQPLPSVERHPFYSPGSKRAYRDVDPRMPYREFQKAMTPEQYERYESKYDRYDTKYNRYEDEVGRRNDRYDRYDKYNRSNRYDRNDEYDRNDKYDRYD